MRETGEGVRQRLACQPTQTRELTRSDPRLSDACQEEEEEDRLPGGRGGGPIASLERSVPSWAMWPAPDPVSIAITASPENQSTPQARANASVTCGLGVKPAFTARGEGLEAEELDLRLETRERVQTNEVMHEAKFQRRRASPTCTTSRRDKTAAMPALLPRAAG